METLINKDIAQPPLQELAGFLVIGRSFSRRKFYLARNNSAG